MKDQSYYENHGCRQVLFMRLFCFWKSISFSCLIFIISVIPGPQVPQIPIWNFDKLVHALIYFWLTVVFCVDLKKARWTALNRYALGIAILGAIGYGGLLEILQSADFIQRSFSWFDFFANGFGAAAAGFILVFMKLSRERNAGFFTLLALLFAVMIVILYFGVRLEENRSVNRVRWSSQRAGISFEPFAMAYTNGFFNASAADPGLSGLTIEMAIEPDFSEFSSFKFLVLVHGGRDEEQLCIGQWRSSLVIMNGDDYSNRRRMPKIYIKLDENAKGPQLVSIISGNAGTRVYLDGMLKKTNTALVLRFPDQMGQAHLVVGNSMNGNQPWKGKLYGLAFYNHGLEKALNERHHQVWQAEKSFIGFKDAEPRLLYTFDEGSGNIVRNKMGDSPDLMIPGWMKILQKKVLSWPKLYGVAGTSLMGDIVLNLIGFIPLGFIMMALALRIDGLNAENGRSIVVLIAFVYSLFIEVTQAWIPSRDSSLLDLLLNTLGGYLGVLFFQRLMDRRQRTSH